jgi:hypothetical protein
MDNSITLLYRCDDILRYIISACDLLSKFILHFVSKRFKYLTLDNKENRKLNTSYIHGILIDSIPCTCQAHYLKMIRGQIYKNKQIIFRTLKMSKCGYYYYVDICKYAAANGFLNILKWAKELKFPWDTNTTKYATLNGHCNVLMWAIENGCKMKWDPFYFAHAIEKKHTDLIDWFIVCKYPCDIKVVLCAAEYGPLNLLKILIFREFILDGVEVFRHAIIGGQLDIVIWLNKYYMWPSDTIELIIFFDHPKILEWILTNGYPWKPYDMDIWIYAVRKNNQTILDWLENNNSEYSIADIQAIIKSNCDRNLRQAHINMKVNKCLFVPSSACSFQPNFVPLVNFEYKQCICSDRYDYFSDVKPPTSSTQYNDNENQTPISHPRKKQRIVNDNNENQTPISHPRKKQKIVNIEK